MANQEGMTTEELRKSAGRLRQELNQRFIEARKSEGVWTCPNRGSGLQVTLEAIDSLVTQTDTARQALPYDSQLLLQDFIHIRDLIVSSADLETSFPLFSALNEDRSSPETAALLLRVLRGVRAHLRRTGKWTPELATDFEALIEKALEFLLGSFRMQEDAEGGGWGMFRDEPLQIYFTVAVVRAFSDFIKGNLAKPADESRMRKCLRDAHAYIRFCKEDNRKEPRISKWTSKYSKDHKKLSLEKAYSAYSLLGLLALWDVDESSDKSQVAFEEEVLPVFDFWRLRDLAEPSDAISPYLAKANYEDVSGLWMFLRVTMLWLSRQPDFYTDSWQESVDLLLNNLLTGERPQAIYLWNRSVLALATYESYSARLWQITNYKFRKLTYELLKEPQMAKAAFDYFQQSISKE